MKGLCGQRSPRVLDIATRIGLLGWLGLGCGSGDEDGPLRFVGLADGDYLRGVQVSELDVRSGLTVERTALYLDGLRISADEFAPFELVWDSRDFVEGKHELMARADLGDGTQLFHRVAIQIDNTLPVLSAISASAEVDQRFEFDARDNARLSRVEVIRRMSAGPDEIVAAFTAPPFSFVWRFPCGAVELEIRAYDAAGGEVTQAITVTGIDVKDRDCDGHRSPSFGGDDCNDANPDAYPGAPERTDLVDRDCDGLAGIYQGTDMDHDGVPSSAVGGSDCNDEDPAIHGSFFVYSDRTFTVGGVPLQWNPGEAFSPREDYNGELFLNRGGVVTRVMPGPGGDALEILASGANAGSLAVTHDRVAFGQHNQVVVLIRDGEHHWVSHGTINADAPVGRLAYARGTGGTEYCVFQAGTEVWLAIATDGTWSRELLVDADAALAEAPGLEPSFSSAFIAFRTAIAAWGGTTYGLGSTSIEAVGPRGAIPTAVAAFPYGGTLVAVEQSSGSAIFQQGSPAPVGTFPHRVTGIFHQYPYLFVQTEGPELAIFSSARSFARLQTVLNVGVVDTAAPNSFIGSGHLYRLTSRSVFPAVEAADDHIDSNCDGFDY